MRSSWGHGRRAAADSYARLRSIFTEFDGSELHGKPTRMIGKVVFVVRPLTFGCDWEDDRRLTGRLTLGLARVRGSDHTGASPGGQGTEDRPVDTAEKMHKTICLHQHEAFLHADRGLTSATGAAALLYMLAILASHHLIMSWCQNLGSRGNNVCNGAGALWLYATRSLLLKRHSEAHVRVATPMYELHIHASYPNA